MGEKKIKLGDKKTWIQTHQLCSEWDLGLSFFSGKLGLEKSGMHPPKMLLNW